MMASLTEMIAFLIEINDTGGKGQGHVAGADTLMTESHPQGQTILGVDTPDLDQGHMTGTIRNLDTENQEIPGQGHDQIQQVILVQGQGQKEEKIISQETDHVQGHAHDLTDIQGQG